MAVKYRDRFVMIRKASFDGKIRYYQSEIKRLGEEKVDAVMKMRSAQGTVDRLLIGRKKIEKCLADTNLSDKAKIVYTALVLNPSREISLQEIKDLEELKSAGYIDSYMTVGKVI